MGIEYALGERSRLKQREAQQHRIAGAVKMGTVWLIPKDAEKPIDGRTKQGRKRENEQACV